jgi:hypothetical protein
MQPPAQRYAPSPRSLPGALPPIEYGPDDLVRKVQQGGWISFKGRQLRVSKALVGQPVALRPCIEADGLCLRSVQLRGAARSAVAIQPIRSISHHAAALLHVFGVVAGRANRVRSARDNRASIQSSGQPITLN